MSFQFPPSPSPGELYSFNGKTWSWDATNGVWVFVGGSAAGPTGSTGPNIWSQTGTAIYYTAGNVGIGTTNPSLSFDVVGNTRLGGQLDLRSYIETETAPTISGNSLTLDLSTGSIFDVALNNNITTLSITNVPATASRAVSFVIIFTGDGTARAVTWPPSFRWVNNLPPTITSTNGKRDVFAFLSTDNGTSWNAFVSGQNI